MEPVTVLCPARKILRRMGYLSDQRGIINRYLVEGEAWDSHLHNVKEFIKKSAKNKSRGNVAVLGSGWLLDLPMDYLLHEFREVQLYNICHPPQIVHKYRGNPKAKFIEMDLTGGAIQQVYESIKKHHEERGKPSMENISGDVMNWNHADFVISLNILNQLDILLVDYMRRFKTFSNEEENLFRSIIQSNHLRSLPEKKSCLITDYREMIYEDTGNLSEEKKLIFTEFPEAGFEEEWIWNFDLKMNYNAGKKTVFQVKALDF